MKSLSCQNQQMIVIININRSHYTNLASIFNSSSPVNYVEIMNPFTFIHVSHIRSDLVLSSIVRCFQRTLCSKILPNVLENIPQKKVCEPQKRSMTMSYSSCGRTLNYNRLLIVLILFYFVGKNHKYDEYFIVFLSVTL